MSTGQVPSMYLACSVIGGTEEVEDSMSGVFTGLLVSVGASLVVASATSLALRAASQICCVAGGKGHMLIFLGCESFTLFCLVSGTRLCFLAATLGLG